MRVLVTAASRHGATWDIARAIADALVQDGIEVAVLPARDVAEVTGFDAVIVGSAVYQGRWLASGRDLVARLAADLRRRPVWLFSSGPLGWPTRSGQPPVDVAELLSVSGAVSHQVFGGRLERTRLSLPERSMVAALRVRDRDDRDWSAIADWSKAIAERLRAPHAH